MKYRNIFKGLRLWFRATSARRQYKRALKDFHALKISSKRENDRIIHFYEKKLEIERTRFTIMMTQWADRFLQKDNLPGVALSTLGLEDRVVTRDSQTDSEDSNLEGLGKDEIDLYVETKRQFYVDGENEGKSPAEIDMFWKEMRDPILSTVRSQFDQ